MNSSKLVIHLLVGTQQLMVQVSHSLMVKTLVMNYILQKIQKQQFMLFGHQTLIQHTQLNIIYKTQMIHILNLQNHNILLLNMELQMQKSFLVTLLKTIMDLHSIQKKQVLLEQLVQTEHLLLNYTTQEMHIMFHLI